MRSMKSLRLWVRKLWGYWTLSAVWGLQSVLRGRGMAIWHAGSSMHHLYQAWQSQKVTQLRDTKVGFFLPTSRFFIYLAFGNLLCLQFFCFHTGVKSVIPALFFLLDVMTAWLSLMFRWKKDRKDARDTAMQSRKCKWVSKHLVRVH